MAWVHIKGNLYNLQHATAIYQDEVPLGWDICIEYAVTLPTRYSSSTRQVHILLKDEAEADLVMNRLTDELNAVVALRNKFSPPDSVGEEPEKDSVKSGYTVVDLNGVKTFVRSGSLFHGGVV